MEKEIQFVANKDLHLGKEIGFVKKGDVIEDQILGDQLEKDGHAEVKEVPAKQSEE